MDLYNNPTQDVRAPSFVLLVGDTSQLPASYSSGGHVSDLDYADFTNDNIPDVLCGRFSGQNSNHIEAQINKTLQRQRNVLTNRKEAKNIFTVPKPRLQISKYSLSYIGPLDYNDLKHPDGKAYATNI